MMNQSSQKSIMIVDDIPENLQLLVEVLTNQGYRTRAALNGEQALASIQKEAPDLILLDILMPDMDGFEVCRRLKSNEELRDIPVIFISALDEIFDKVAAFNVGGVDYITKPFQVEEVLARVHTHLSLRELQQQLEAQNQELEAYAHTVAHDLKNPVNLQVGFANLLLTEDLSEEEQQTALQSISTGAQKMVRIIDELLLLASASHIKNITINTLGMGTIVDLAQERLIQHLEEEQVEIILPEKWPEAVGYAPWVEEIWVNYISNAIKYGGNPPFIELGADIQPDGMIRFWVKDNGKGLTAEEMARLFTQFSRLDQTRSKGHGLGLSIVKRIIERLNGQVDVESSPGQGSIFSFTLPAAD